MENNDQLFRSVRSVYIALAAYVNKVGKEIGEEKALEYLSSSFAEIGEFQGKKLKRLLLESQKPNATEAFDLIKAVPFSIGINLMIPKKESDKVVARLDKCPIFECAKVVGIDPATFCDNTAVPYYDTIAKQLNMDLKFERNKIKSSPDDFCEEQLIDTSK